MIFLRSALYNLFFYLWTAVMSVLGVMSFVSYKLTIKWIYLWTGGLLLGARLICGIRHEVKGAIPEGGVILASKHQSAWETLVFYHLFKEPVYVFKKGLGMIPFFGWYHYFSKNISVNRGNGISAVKSLVKQATDRLNKNRQVVIFPEGTRVKVGEEGKYHTGIYAIYSKTGATVVPVALNSGLLWEKNSFIRKSGTITLEFLQPIESGLNKSDFMKLLEERIESASERLQSLQSSSCNSPTPPSCDG